MRPAFKSPHLCNVMVASDADAAVPSSREPLSTPTGDDGVVAGNGPTIITDGYNEIAIGCFVFLRNARFNPVTESTSNPRYWVARVTAGGGAAPSTVRWRLRGLAWWRH